MGTLYEGRGANVFSLLQHTDIHMCECLREREEEGRRREMRVNGGGRFLSFSVGNEEVVDRNDYPQRRRHAGSRTSRLSR